MLQRLCWEVGVGVGVRGGGSSGSGCLMDGNMLWSTGLDMSA
jgi:hypothetical protein